MAVYFFVPSKKICNCHPLDRNTCFLIFHKNRFYCSWKLISTSIQGMSFMKSHTKQGRKPTKLCLQDSSFTGGYSSPTAVVLAQPLSPSPPSLLNSTNLQSRRPLFRGATSCRSWSHNVISTARPLERSLYIQIFWRIASLHHTIAYLLLGLRSMPYQRTP